MAEFGDMVRKYMAEFDDITIDNLFSSRLEIYSMIKRWYTFDDYMFDKRCFM